MEHLKHACFSTFHTAKTVILMHETCYNRVCYSVHEPCMIPETCLQHARICNVLQADTTHITCMDCCLHFMHVPCMGSGMKHACFMLIRPYFMHGVYSMHSTGIFHAWYRHIPCMVQVYSCIVQAYCMCGTGVFRM